MLKDTKSKNVLVHPSYFPLKTDITLHLSHLTILQHIRLSHAVTKIASLPAACASRSPKFCRTAHHPVGDTQQPTSPCSFAPKIQQLAHAVGATTMLRLSSAWLYSTFPGTNSPITITTVRDQEVQQSKKSERLICKLKARC